MHHLDNLFKQSMQIFKLTIKKQTQQLINDHHSLKKQKITKARTQQWTVKSMRIEEIHLKKIT